MRYRKSILRVAALLTLAALLLSGCFGDPKSLRVKKQKENPDGQVVEITTSYCVVKYPIAFQDQIRVDAENQEDRAELKFSVLLNNAEYPLYSLIFGGNEGIPVGTLTRKDGTVVSVAILFCQADESLDMESLQSFYAVQETLNDVLQSLAENKQFTPAA